MAIPYYKNQMAKLPTCKFCGAIGKHFSWQCQANPKNICTYCQGVDHRSMNCSKKPQKKMLKESGKSREKRLNTRKEWFKLNPPSEKGEWICYLNFSPECPLWLTRSTIQLEHVKSKARHPELRYDVANIRPACAACNKLKGSLDVEEIGTIKNKLLLITPRDRATNKVSDPSNDTS